MTLVDLLVLLVVAGICGAIGQAIVGYSHAGCLGTIAVGFVGALLGTFIARSMHLPEILTVRVDRQAFPIIWSIAGAALFVSLLSLLSGRRWRLRTG
jgi:uncharacterized membrane protein YeaQ/YmgE (transglycosylase-associated protein family)